MFSWLQKLWTGKPSHTAARKPKRVFRCELLEDRTVPIASVANLTSTTAAQLVQVLTGGQVKVSNIRYIGTNQQAGIFSGGQTSVGIKDGVILSSGNAQAVVGVASTFASTATGAVGDPALTVIAGAPTFDAAILEFDFVSIRSGVLVMQYVFGSEEYPEFVNAGFNDAFAVYLNGKRVNYIPGTNTPVAIDNVNAGVNSRYFVDNTGNARATTMDGFTVPITNIVTAKAGQTHRVRLAIADAGDTAYDSNVLIKRGSFIPANITLTPPPRFTYNRATRTFDGIFIIKNYETYSIPGPLFAAFSVQSGTKITNPNFINPRKQATFRLPAGIAAGGSVKITMKISNPNNLPLGTVFLNSVKMELYNILV